MRLTPNKVNNWHARIERARRTIENVEAEAKAHRLQAKGGDLSALTALCQQNSSASVLRYEEAMLALAEREDRKAAGK